jgi:hypothetical protein
VNVNSTAKLTTDSENKIKWYCKKDYVPFLQDCNKDIVKCSEILVNKGFRALSTQDLFYFSGLELETFLSRNVPRRIQKIRDARDMYIAAVLYEQKPEETV